MVSALQTDVLFDILEKNLQVSGAIMKKASLLFFFVLFFLGHLAKAQSPAKPHIAVLNLDAVGVSEDVALTLSDRLRNELAQTNAFVLVERNQMDKILQEQGFELSGCTSDACAIEAGRLLNVQEICVGSVGKVGNLYTVSLRLINVETGQVIKTVSEDCPCPIEAVLTRSMHNVALKLAGLLPNQTTPLTGKLAVRSQPAQARIFIDGKDYGQTPATVSLPAGKHVLVLQKDRFASARKSVEVVPRQTQSVQLTLKPLATLLITTEPAGAQIEINGQAKGQSPLNLDVPPDSTLSIRIQKTNYENVTQTVTLKPGAFQKLHFTLSPKTGRIYFSGLPQGSRVFVNGQRVALKNDSIELPFGHYQIQLAHPGYYVQTLEMDLQADEIKTVNAQLTPKTITGAVLRSAVLPGWGQHYQGKKVRGWFFTLATLAGGGASFYYWQRYKASKDEYEATRQSYLKAYSSATIEFYRDRMHEKYDQTNNWQTKTNLAIGLTAAVWVWNLLDTVLFPPQYEKKIGVKGTAQNGHFSVGLTVQW